VEENKTLVSALFADDEWDPSAAPAKPAKAKAAAAAAARKPKASATSGSFLGDAEEDDDDLLFGAAGAAGEAKPKGKPPSASVFDSLFDDF
jgi:hypothetical protein